MRKCLAALALAAALALGGCTAGEAPSLRGLCAQVNRLASQSWPSLQLTQFTRAEAQGGWEYSADWGDRCLLAAQTLPDGRVHTVALAAAPELDTTSFLAAALLVTRAFTLARPDEAERWLGQLGAGAPEILGIESLEANGFRFSCMANAAGRCLRVSSLALLPPEPEQPTLREKITGG